MRKVQRLLGSVAVAGGSLLMVAGPAFAGGSSGGGDDDLPGAGSSSPVPMIAIGVASIAVGSVLLAARRRSAARA